ncbi:MAG: GNAT family N-acetyltransferase [Microgenomates group bacterium]
MAHANIINKKNVFERYRQQWHALLEKVVNPHIFMTPEFMESWWNTLGEGELAIITVIQDDELIGIAPLCIVTNSNDSLELKFVGCKNVSDYLDFIYDPAYEDEFFETIGEILEGTRILWETAEFCSIPHLSITFAQLQKHTNFTFTKNQQDVCPVVTLPQSWDEYLANLDRKQRHEIRRKFRKIEEESTHEFKLISESSQMPEASELFIQLHGESSVEKARFWDQKHKNFFKHFLQVASEKNWVRLFFLYLENRAVSTMLIFDFNNQYFLYNSGYLSDQYQSLSTGSVLTAFTIKHAIERHKTHYDFLRGDEAYKFKFGAEPEAIFDITFDKQS